MVKIKVIILLMIAFGFGNGLAHAEPIEKLIRSGTAKVIDPFDRGQSVQVQCAQWSDHDWAVHLENGEVMADDKKLLKGEEKDAVEVPFPVVDDPAIPSSPQTKKIFPVEDGFLISFTAGEWGSSLWWYSKDGQDRKEVVRLDLHHRIWGFVNEFMPTRDGLYLLTGLAHLSVDEGGIAKIENTQNGWVFTRFIDLNSATAAYFPIDEDNYLVLSNKKIVRLSPRGESKTLYEPLNDYKRVDIGDDSIVQDKEGNIYVGGRYKIVRLKPVSGGYQEEWIIPDHCQWVVQSDGVCQCPKAEAQGTEAGK